ncbi:amidohydrolase 2 [Chiua virens]|nr:amidohydrolase 2 [Chiua virens]
MYYRQLADITLTYPAIDNHAHPILTEKNRNAFPLEGIISEATDDALTLDAPYTLASYRATAQLSKLFGLKDGEPGWEALKNKRDNTVYLDLCELCFKPTGIQCILLDDGLGNVAELAESINWHNQFTTSPCKRIVRIEHEAEVRYSIPFRTPIFDHPRPKNILRNMLERDPTQISTSVVSVVDVFETLSDRFRAIIVDCARDDNVAGFKSVVCYRTGLDIAPPATFEEMEGAIRALLLQYKTTESVRLQHKVLNDFLVRTVLEIAGQYRKPGRFQQPPFPGHLGLGDNDIRLVKTSPAHMQPIIEAYPETPIILLHSSYPFTRDAGYLTAVYKNVYLDFGEIFPFLSGEGQREVIRQMLDLAPTNKILWSSMIMSSRACSETSAHVTQQLTDTGGQNLIIWPVYKRARRSTREELTEHQAIEIVKNALFHNANRIYNLGLEPNTRLV